MDEIVCKELCKRLDKIDAAIARLEVNSNKNDLHLYGEPGRVDSVGLLQMVDRHQGRIKENEEDIKSMKRAAWAIIVLLVMNLGGVAATLVSQVVMSQ